MAAPHFLHVFGGFGRGGLELRTASIIDNLGSNVRHSIFAINGNYDAASRIGHTPVKFLNTRTQSGRWSPLALRGLVGGAGADLLLTYNWGSMDAVAGCCFAPYCPIVHHEGGLSVEEADHRKLRRRIARGVVLNRIFRTIVVSSTLLHIARQEYRIGAARLQFIRNGIDVARFFPGRSPDLRQSMGLRDSDLLFGFAGRLSDEKNLPLLLRSFHLANLEGAKLLLVGDGPRSGDLRRLVQELGLADRTIFAGHAEDVLPYYRAMDVFVMSSATEQTPNALLEAMACGLPVLSTDVGDCAELLGHNREPVIVGPGDVSAYSGALQALARDAVLRARLGAENRSRCVAQFSFDRMLNEYRSVYARALGISSADLL